MSKGTVGKEKGKRGKGKSKKRTKRKEKEGNTLVKNVILVFLINLFHA